MMVDARIELANKRMLYLLIHLQLKKVLVTKRFLFGRQSATIPLGTDSIRALLKNHHVKVFLQCGCRLLWI